MNINFKKLIIIVSLVLIIIAGAFALIFISKNKDKDKIVDYYGYMFNPKEKEKKYFLVTFQMVNGKLGKDLTCMTDNTLLYTDEKLYKEIIGKMKVNNLSSEDVNKLGKVFSKYQGIKLDFEVRNVTKDIFAFVTEYTQVEANINMRFKFNGKMIKNDISGKLFLEFIADQDTPFQEVKFGHR